MGVIKQIEAILRLLHTNLGPTQWVNGQKAGTLKYARPAHAKAL